MKENFNRKVLKNGMTVILEKRDLPIVSVGFAARHGGVDEGVEEKGISHFIEHMLYKGTEKRTSKQIAKELEKKGGELNGLTGEELTAFFVKITSKHLNVALDVLSDLVLNSKFDEKELEKERKVIFEEIKMYKDNPRVHIFDEIKKCLYDGTMGMNLAGTYDTMNSIDREKIFKRFKEIYSPNNLILCVVGDANFEDICNFVEKNFGDENFEVPVQEFNLKNNEMEEKRKDIDQANLVLAYHVPFGEDKKSYAACILSAVTAEGMSSRLFQEIREKRNLAYSIGGRCEAEKKFGYNFVYSGCIPENVDLIKKLILEEFEKVVRDLDEDELNEIKEQLIGQYQISMEDSHNQMLNLIVEEIRDNAEKFYEYEKNISEVKLEDVRELAGKVKNNYSFFSLVPSDK